MFSFPERLLTARKKKGLTQGQLADLMGVKSGKQTLSNWELGKTEPGLSELIKLAEVLDTTVAWLAQEDPGNTPAQEVAAGFITVPMAEYIELQRKVIKKQDDELQRK